MLTHHPTLNPAGRGLHVTGASLDLPQSRHQMTIVAVLKSASAAVWLLRSRGYSACRGARLIGRSRWKSKPVERG